MRIQPVVDLDDNDVYLAGQIVAPGTYRQLDSSREIRLDREDRLPASMDGRVAGYVRVVHWARLRGLTGPDSHAVP